MSEQNPSTQNLFPLPAFKNLTLTGTMDVCSGAVEYHYAGAGVTAENYEAYCAELTENGYQLYTANEKDGCLYRTYLNRERGMMLHVTYAAFTYAKEQNVTRYQPCIRVVAAPVGNAPLTETRLLEPAAFDRKQTFASYKKITDSRLTSMQFNRELWHMFGSAFIITLEDGSFVVIDGGIDPAYTRAYNEETEKYDLPVSSTGDEDQLYRVLCDLYRLSHGVRPDGKEHRIRLAAWYVTHFHEDHVGNFIKFAEKYGDKIDAERLIANAPSDAECVHSNDPTLRYRDKIPAICSCFHTPMTYYPVQAGWKFYIRNVEFEVLCTHADLYPEVIYTFNDTSTVIRMSVHNTDGNGCVQGTPATILWLGDMQDVGSQFLRATYGADLRSDMVQISHHGWVGCEWSLYQLVAPRCLLWPDSYGKTTSNGVREYYRPKTYDQEWAMVDYRLVHELPSAEYILVNDKQNVTVTLTKDGPQFALDQLYNAAENDQNPVTQYGDLDTISGILRIPH